MLRKPAFAITTASLYLLLYLIFIFYSASPSLVMLMFAFSPLLIIWMAYIIIRYGTYTGEELKENEEWGYEDKRKEDLGVM